MDVFRKPVLPWVDIDSVVRCAQRRFERAIHQIEYKHFEKRAVELTLGILRAGLTGAPLQESKTADAVVAMTKTMQNAIGIFHQDVLGLVSG